MSFIHCNIYWSTKIGKIKFYSWDDDIGKSTFWHSSAHLLAEAIESIYPGVKFGIGPPIANGFYYDIDFDKYDTSKIDLKKIENKIIELSRNKSEYVREEISKADAISGVYSIWSKSTYLSMRFWLL